MRLDSEKKANGKFCLRPKSGKC